MGTSMQVVAMTTTYQMSKHRVWEPRGQQRCLVSHNVGSELSPRVHVLYLLPICPGDGSHRQTDRQTTSLTTVVPGQPTLTPHSLGSVMHTHIYLYRHHTDVFVKATSLVYLSTGVAAAAKQRTQQSITPPYRVDRETLGLLVLYKHCTRVVHPAEC